jgi:acetyl-CoA C-acetyltransferase
VRQDSREEVRQGEARICGYADAALGPIDFPLAAAKAIPLALSRAGIEADTVAIWEINVTFAAVIVANKQVCPHK